MNPDIKAQWVAALRSGEYTQGYGQLVYHHDTDQPTRHCALGVLCEVAKANGLELEPDPNDPVYHYYGDTRNGFIPNEVQEWAEINLNQQAEVVKINDTQSWQTTDGADLIRVPNFPAVAAWVEENL